MPGDHKALYSQALKTQGKVPLFAEPWWLDATCAGNRWSVFKYKGEVAETVSFLPYQVSLIKGMKAITTPPLTQYLPVMPVEKTAFPLESFLKSLDAFSILDITLKPDSGLPYHDERAKSNFKYSYFIPMSSIETIRAGYNEGLRRNLKTAEKNYSIAEKDDLKKFMDLCALTYNQRQLRIPRRIANVIPALFRQLKDRQRGYIKFAYQGNRPIAGIMVAWDTDTTYYLLGGRSGDEGAASAHAFLLDQAIADAVQHNRSFDFEGSMHPGIANFFQSFGANPETFWRIRKFRGLGRLWSLFQV